MSTDSDRGPQIGPVPPPLRSAAARVEQSRGRLRDFRGIFDQTVVPMLTVDNRRRYVHANMPAQLLFRLPESELRRRRIDDLTAPVFWPALAEAWEVLMASGSVTGKFVVDLPDRSRLCVHYAASTNVLPGQHLVVFTPARWPEDELPDLPEGPQGAIAGPLSPRQREVLRLVATGRDTTQIAAELALSQATVRTHLRDALQRLGARNRAHGVALAMASGLIASSGSLRDLR